MTSTAVQAKELMLISGENCQQWGSRRLHLIQGIHACGVGSLVPGDLLIQLLLEQWQLLEQADCLGDCLDSMT